MKRTSELKDCNIECIGDRKTACSFVEREYRNRANAAVRMSKYAVMLCRTKK